MKSDAVAHCNFFFKNRRMSAIAHVYDGVVLNIRTSPNSNVMDISPNGAVTPDRSFLSQMHVADDLRTWIDIRSIVNLRMHPTKRSNHDSRDSSIRLD